MLRSPNPLVVRSLATNPTLSSTTFNSTLSAVVVRLTRIVRALPCRTALVSLSCATRNRQRRKVGLELEAALGTERDTQMMEAFDIGAVTP